MRGCVCAIFLLFGDPNKVEGEEEEEETKKTKGKKKGKKKKEEEVQETPAVRLDSEEFWNEMFGKDALLLRLDSTEKSSEDVSTYVSSGMISTYQRARPLRRDAEKDFVVTRSDEPSKCQDEEMSTVKNEENEDEKEISLVSERCAPMNDYLAEKVLPSISLGLDKLARERPEDPIEFLASFLKDQCCSK